MAVEPRRRRRFLATIRARATVGAMAVVAVALTAGALLQITVVERHLMDAAESSATLRAISVAEQARTGALPSLIPLADDDTQFVQVVDAGGDVIAASDNLETRRRVVELQPTADHEDDDESDDDEDSEAVEYDDAVAGTFGDLPVDDGGRWRVVAVEVDTADGPLTVLAGESLEDVESTMATLRRSLILGVPILVGIVGLVTLIVIRRSLRPVDTMRTDLDDITSRALDRRITEPTSDDEIASLALAMNDLLDRLQASTARQRQFVGDASHELRSPLAALRTQLDVALAHPDRTDWVATVREAMRDTERVEALASDLLTLARLDDETPDRVDAPVDLGELVADTVEHRVARPPVRIQTRLEPDVVVRGSRQPARTPREEPARQRRTSRHRRRHRAGFARRRTCDHRSDRRRPRDPDRGPGADLRTLHTARRGTHTRRGRRRPRPRDRPRGRSLARGNHRGLRTSRSHVPCQPAARSNRDLRS